MDALDAIVGIDVDVEGDDIAAVGVAPTDDDIGIFDAALVTRILIMVE
jgi:hypothetical protein